MSFMFVFGRIFIKLFFVSSVFKKEKAMGERGAVGSPVRGEKQFGNSWHITSRLAAVLGH
jgi:hypothetical protein